VIFAETPADRTNVPDNPIYRGVCINTVLGPYYQPRIYRLWFLSTRLAVYAMTMLLTIIKGTVKIKTPIPGIKSTRE
jgi:hypothetical protein